MQGIKKNIFSNDNSNRGMQELGSTKLKSSTGSQSNSIDEIQIGGTRRTNRLDKGNQTSIFTQGDDGNTNPFGRRKPSSIIRDAVPGKTRIGSGTISYGGISGKGKDNSIQGIIDRTTSEDIYDENGNLLYTKEYREDVVGGNTIKVTKLIYPDGHSYEVFETYKGDEFISKIERNYNESNELINEYHDGVLYFKKEDGYSYKYFYKDDGSISMIEKTYPSGKHEYEYPREDGGRSVTIPYSNDEHISRIEYDADGNITRVEYSYESPSISSISYYPDGSKESVSYWQGANDWIQTIRYDENGIVTETDYHQGHPNGISAIRYYEDGSVKTIYYWDSRPAEYYQQSEQVYM